MNKKLALMACLVLSGAGIVAWIAWTSRTADSPAKVAAPSPRNKPDTVSYPVGAPQLTMIESRTIPASPIPLSDPLSARVAYDEDVTARLGVGFSGRIVAIKAAPGDMVKAGQVLAEIDSSDFGSAYADLNKARADEQRKRLVLERAKALGPGEGIAAKDLEAAQADYTEARAETARAEQRLKNLNPHGFAVRGQRVSLASPINGVVTERTATPALEVGSGLSAPLFVVTDTKRLWLMIDIPEKLLGRMKVGGEVTVETDAFPDERFRAKIVQLGQLMDPNTRRATARARLDNASGKLLPEMFVRASVLEDSGAGVRVPNTAIVNRGVHAFVFVQTAPGEFLRRQVKLLTRGSDSSYVGEGLQGGERVVVKGALLLDAELTARAGDKP
ncbi:efflux RND transporter periplasmic adaptor subunit [Cupriavidus neocaledonicus]|uniref:Cation efflux system protein n=1 Tax=Cupriavidus neocaledonicus TaxID=1040979 RepID=A0A375H4X4_9BURK|nr:efflux RND transporter periplasmic adaptor subunit [Cupriavidus neocaledonicus]SOZ38427.1 Cation efflux system protein [Cupriavidus neocaledonicus]SPD46732.1 Cation efflux system protein [Cupriavidus neocaledonicus]